MSSITFSGLKTVANTKQNIINSTTPLSCGTISTQNRTYANKYAIIGGNFVIDYTTTYIKLQSTNSKPLVFNKQNNLGNFGINTLSSPSYVLYVAGNSTTSTNTRYYATGAANSTLASISDVSAYFGSSIISIGPIYFSSDKRIKTNIQDIDDDSALQMIMKIQPKIYEYIDKVEKGNNKVYGFIAQQIKEVIPDAVSLESLVIPNIYKIGTLSDSNVITMDTDISDIIKTNSNISLVTSNLGKQEYKVNEVNSNQFTINTNINDSNVFVYGTKTNDFHTLDKNYIFTLNISANQELYKLIQINQSNINQLNEGYVNMSNNINLIKNKINSIK